MLRAITGLGRVAVLDPDGIKGEKLGTSVPGVVVVEACLVDATGTGLMLGR